MKVIDTSEQKLPEYSNFVPWENVPGLCIPSIGNISYFPDSHASNIAHQTGLCCSQWSRKIHDTQGVMLFIYRHSLAISKLRTWGVSTCYKTQHQMHTQNYAESSSLYQTLTLGKCLNKINNMQTMLLKHRGIIILQLPWRRESSILKIFHPNSSQCCNNCFWVFCGALYLVVVPRAWLNAVPSPPCDICQWVEGCQSVAQVNPPIFTTALCPGPGHYHC